MPPKNNGKNGSASDIKVVISPLSIINDSRLKPYIESFSHSPSNIIQQPLGNLLGFLRIRDASEDSAYIVNFLSSVIKKEYYINPKRFVENSFDSALHKANVALSELAKNGNINWLGMIDGAVCVFENNNFHFSVTGEAKILLLRNNLLTEISEGLADIEEEPHPLKTFVNVSSGSIKPGDKIIITSDDLFRVFSLTEIKKNANRFQGEKFVQFLHTALVNELEAAETIIIDVTEAEKIKKRREKETAPEEEILNVFSEKAFREPVHIKAKGVAEKTGSANDFVDEKTGHIYVQQEDKSGIHREGRLHFLWFIFLENLSDFSFWLKEKVRKMLYFGRQKLKSIFLEIKSVLKEAKTAKIQAPETSSQTISVASRIKNYAGTTKEKISIRPLKSAFGNIAGNILKSFPDFSRVRKIFTRLSREQRIYGIIIILAIIVLPLLYVKMKSPKEVAIPVQETVQVKNQKDILINDKNINLETTATVIDSSGQGVAAIFLDSSVFIATKNSIIEFDEKGSRNEFALPGSSGDVIASTGMVDLKLVLLLTDQKKIFSWSPVTRDFKANTINIPGDANISSLGTYLTYLYLMDNKNSQIYRYPRAEGGFGEKANWLKDQMNLGAVSDMAIDENIYLAEGNALIKLFRGKLQDFNIEQSVTPINFEKVFTTGDTDKIYILDGANSRIVIFGKDGMIQQQYYNELLKNAGRFTVDYKNNKAYVITASGNLATLQL